MYSEYHHMAYEDKPINADIFHRDIQLALETFNKCLDKFDLRRCVYDREIINEASIIKRWESHYASSDH